MSQLFPPSSWRLKLAALAVAGCSTAPACAQKTTTSMLGVPVRSTRQTDSLTANFLDPPSSTKPRTYWYWIDGRVSKQGITHDLEAMKKIGVGEAYIGVLGGEAGDTGPGGIPALTEEWWQHIEHAVREGGRLGVDIGIFNGPGWSQSGGPWVKPEQSQRYLVTTELRLKGPQKFDGALIPPPGMLPGQDVAAIAFPAPEADGDSIAARNPKISGDADTAKLFDGNFSTSASPPEVDGKHAITLEVEKPFTARSLVFHPVREIVSSGELQVSDDGMNYRRVCDYTIDRHYLAPALGPEGLAPVSLSFPATTGRFFRFTFSNADPLKEIVLSGAARIENYSEKHLGKMFQGPQPPDNYYDWPRQPEPDKASLSIPPGQVQSISPHLQGDHLTWDVPEGEWIIQRIGMASTRSSNHPAPAGAGGLEIDKLNRVPLRAHFDAYVGKLLERMPEADRKALKHVVIDSYETGSQNWTDGLGNDFKRHYGYDPTPYLPALGGRVVGSVDQTSRFLWDLRRLAADRVASEYIGGLRDLSNEKGLKLWSENYGHGGFFGEFLNYGKNSDEISGEFWESGNPGQIELRDASSSGHIYGKNVIFAEAWTGGPAFISTPWSLKKMGDWAFCQGVNQMVFHVNISQPDETRPGISAWFGTEFNRHNTWYGEAKSWVDYLRRCHYMLQQGKYVADVAYFIGEDVPKMSGVQNPLLSAGYSYDYINADAIINRLSFKGGRFTLPDGVSYRVLVIPPGSSLRPETLAKVQQMVEAGGVVLGNPPTQSPSLQDYPQCDQKIQSMAGAMWGGCDGVEVKSAAVGKGRVFRNESLENVFAELNYSPDLDVSEGALSTEILFTHRRTADADIYFLSNQSDRNIKFVPSFRVANRAPEQFDPVTGKRTLIAVYDSAGGRTRVPLTLSPRSSQFVVFRGVSSPRRILKVTEGGRTLTSTAFMTSHKRAIEAKPNFESFTVSAWVKPQAQTAMPNETKTGFSDLYSQRNDFVFPQQGDELNLGPGYAGSGFAVGTNGIVVYEHGGKYFVPILAYPTPIKDWTHVAVVYDKGQTSLYINGQLVHRGLKTDHKIQPSAPNSSFIGSSSGYRLTWRPLASAEIKGIMQATSPVFSTVDALGGPLQLARSADGLSGVSWKSGSFTLQPAAGKPIGVQVPSVMSPITVNGPWSVDFPAGSGASPLKIDHLASLSEQSDPTVKYFSGTATYSKSIALPAMALGKGKHLYLDLGEVGSLAQVILNGQELGTLWSAPFIIDITSAARVGANDLKVRVTNVWHNRLVGQRLKPEAFDGPRVEKVWTSSMPQYGPGEALLDSGLIGPVILRQAVDIRTH